MPDPDFPQADSLKEHNLEVTLADSAQVAATVQAIKSAAVNAEITVNAEEDRRASLRAGMSDEMDAAIMGPGNFGPQTKGMTKGIVKGVLVGTVVGAVALFLIGLVVWSTKTGLVATTAIGAFAGATVGYVMGGSFGPRIHDEGSLEADTQPVIGIHADSSEELEKVERVLSGRKGIARIDRVNIAGRPVGAASKDTRPLRGETPT